MSGRVRGTRAGRGLSTPALVLVIAGAAALGGWYFRFGVRDHVIAKNFGVVREGALYRSGELTPATFRLVHERHAIRTIVDLGAWEEGSREDRLAQRTAESLGITRYRFDLEGDATGNPNWYAHALRIMLEPANQPVLVHCGAGSERTGCTFILFRHMVEGVPIEEGYAEAQQFKHRPSRNPKLRQVLEAWAGPIEDAVRRGGLVEGAEPIPTPGPVGRGEPPEGDDAAPQG